MTASAEEPPAILAAGAVKAVVERLVHAAEVADAGPLHDRGDRLGAPLAMAFGTVGTIRDRILAGERPALAILSQDAIDRLIAAGLATADRSRPLGRTGVALAIGADRPAPDLATADALRAALLAAPSFAQADPTSGATAGAHMARVITRLGIADAMREKTRLVRFGVEAVAMVARGEVALAASQATEIIAQPGVALAGLLPEALQRWTPYAAAILTPGPLAEQLLDILTGEAGRAAFAATGFTS